MRTSKTFSLPTPGTHLIAPRHPFSLDVSTRVITISFPTASAYRQSVSIVGFAKGSFSSRDKLLFSIPVEALMSARLNPRASRVVLRAAIASFSMVCRPFARRPRAINTAFSCSTCSRIARWRTRSSSVRALLTLRTFRWGIFSILYFKGGDGIQGVWVNLFIDHANVATIGRVTKGNWSSRGPTDPGFIGGHQDRVDVFWCQSVFRDVCYVAVFVFVIPEDIVRGHGKL